MSKKNFLLALGFLGFSTGIGAQITVTNATFPALGDTLHYAFDAHPNVLVLTPPGGNQTWDFSSLNAEYTQNQVYRSPASGNASGSFPGANLLTVSNNAETYLEVNNQTLKYLGYAGADPVGLGFNGVFHYNPPIVERRAPLNFFDINQISSGILYPFSPTQLPPVILQQLPFTPDSLRIRIAFNQLDVVNAWGNLIIPLGTYAVLLEKRTTYQEVRLDAKVPPLGWLDVTDIVSNLGIGALGVDTTVTYNFYNDVSKEIIASVNAGSGGDYPQLVQYKTGPPAVSGVSPLETEGAELTAFPNPAGTRVRLRFQQVQPGSYSLKVFNALGTELMHQSWQIPGNRFEADLDLESVPSGVYRYTLFDEHNKPLFTRTLVVVK